MHVPRRPYVETLPGIPTIRPFEALACGTPVVAALAVLVLVPAIGLSPQLFAVSSDEEFARTQGLRTGAYNLLIGERTWRYANVTVGAGNALGFSSTVCTQSGSAGIKGAGFRLPRDIRGTPSVGNRR